jgi:hypothetical protein
VPQAPQPSPFVTQASIANVPQASGATVPQASGATVPEANEAPATEPGEPTESETEPIEADIQTCDRVYRKRSRDSIPRLQTSKTETSIH